MCVCVCVCVLHVRVHVRVRERGVGAEEQHRAIEDALERLLIPSLEREWWREGLESAHVASLASFALNVRNKLLQPPVGFLTVHAEAVAWFALRSRAA